MSKNVNYVLISSDNSIDDEQVFVDTYPIVKEDSRYITFKEGSEVSTLMKYEFNHIKGLGNDSNSPYYSERYSMFSNIYSIEDMISKIVNRMVKEANERESIANNEMESAMSYSGHVEELVSDIKEKYHGIS